MIRHISTSIDGLLTLHDFELQQMLKSVTDEEGKHPTLDEFRQWLMLEKAKGHRLVRSRTVTISTRLRVAWDIARNALREGPKNFYIMKQKF